MLVIEREHRLQTYGNTFAESFKFKDAQASLEDFRFGFFAAYTKCNFLQTFFPYLAVQSGSMVELWTFGKNVDKSIQSWGSRCRESRQFDSGAILPKSFTRNRSVGNRWFFKFFYFENVWLSKEMDHDYLKFVLPMMTSDEEVKEAAQQTVEGTRSLNSKIRNIVLLIILDRPFGTGNSAAVSRG